VDRADVGDHRHFRLGDRCQLGNLTAAPHRHLQHQRLSVVGRFQQRQRQADLVVEVLVVGVNPARQQRPGDVLDRGLANRAGDAEDAGAESPAPGPRQRLHRHQRIIDREDPGAAFVLCIPLGDKGRTPAR
jgi:hypothetical protein